MGSWPPTQIVSRSSDTTRSGMEKPGCPVAQDNQEILLGNQWEPWLPSGQLYFSSMKLERYRNTL